MGKKLIVKGADFSQNAVAKSLILAIDSMIDINRNNTDGNPSSGPYVDNRYENLYSKHIAEIELVPTNAGFITIQGYKNGVFTEKAVLNITQDMVLNVTSIPVSIDVENNEIICIGKRGDTACWKYYNNTSYGFITLFGTANQKTRTWGLAVNFYVFDE